MRQCFPKEDALDDAGPYLVRQVYDATLEMYKAYIMLYTCAVTRAVRLDMGPSLETCAFIRSLKRFIGRRGVPNQVISDNARCFKNEEVRLSEELLVMGIKHGLLKNTDIQLSFHGKNSIGPVFFSYLLQF